MQTSAGEYLLHADWVIDCSGSHSSLRADALAQSARTDDRWLICDVFFDKPPPHERRTWISAPFNQGRAAWQHVMADGVCRVDYQLDPQCDLEHAASDAAIREKLRLQFGGESSFEIVWVGAWTYRSECLATFRLRRVLYAGDAAHVMSPFGARGGNSGIQDADNLVWKLAMVLSGKAEAAPDRKVLRAAPSGGAEKHPRHRQHDAFPAATDARRKKLSRCRGRAGPPA